MISPGLLLYAYSNGSFPMAARDQYDSPVVWHNPDPRAILPMGGLHTSRSFRRFVRKLPPGIKITADQQFREVISLCARLRDTSWINLQIYDVFLKAHALGYAHSVELRDENGRLTGGVYGLAIGHAFFAESMFSLTRSASRIALTALHAFLIDRQYELFDIQYLNPHTESLGGIEISRDEYLPSLKVAVRNFSVYPADLSHFRGNFRSPVDFTWSDNTAIPPQSWAGEDLTGYISQI